MSGGGNVTPAKRLIMMGVNPGKMQPISNLPVGALVKDITTKYYGSPIIWTIADKNHADYPANSVTLLSKYILTLKCLDAKEPSSSDSYRQSSGNNRYLYSNIRQWLNSAAAAGAWYTAQHSADAPPTNANVWDGYNAYDAQAGFQNDFSANFRNALLSTSLTVVKASVDGDGTETVVDKVFLLSKTEVGLANEGFAEGSKLALFSDNTSRLAYPTALCVSNSEYTSTSLKTDSPWDWLLRTPYAWFPNYVRCVNSNGTAHYSGAYYGYRGVRPACNLPSSILVSDTPDGDGAYIIQGFVQAKNELVYTPATWAEWEGIGASSGTSVVDNYLVIENAVTNANLRLNCNFKPNTRYGMLIHIRFNTREGHTFVYYQRADYPFENDFRIPAYATGNFKHVSATKAEFSMNMMYIFAGRSAGKIELGKYRVFELPAGSQIEWDFENLGADQLDAKYPF